MRFAVLLGCPAAVGDCQLTSGPLGEATRRDYAVAGFVTTARALGCPPPMADRPSRPALHGSTTPHAGYAASQFRRKLVEECFGWAETVGPLRKQKHRGVTLVGWVVQFTLAMYSLVRLLTRVRAGECPA